MVEVSLIERDRHDGDAVACLVAPQTLAAGATSTPTISMRGYDRALFSILGGAANDGTATLTMLVQQCDAAAASGTNKVLAGLYGTKSIGPITSGAGFATLNQKWLIEVSAEEMDVDAGFDWLRLVVTVSTADTWLVAVEAQRSGADYEPVSRTNITGAIGTTA